MSYFRSDLKLKQPVKIDVPIKKRMMCLNESSLNPFHELRSEFIRQLDSIPLNRYFNDITSILKQKLSEYTDVPEDHLIFGNGADEMLYYLFNSVREDNRSFAVSLSPSYFDYKSYSSAVGLGIKFLHLNENYDFDTEDLLALAEPTDCKLIILCNPNNPTGNLLDESKIMDIITNSNKLVLIDETYFEFSSITFKDHLAKCENLVIIRSFSKAFSAAGLRFGYLMSNPKNIYEIKKVMTIFNLNLMTQAFVVSMLANKSIFLSYNQRVIEQRDWLFYQLSSISGLQVKNTSTNFLLFTAFELSRKLFEFLTDSEIAVRPIGAHPLLKDYLRVSISSKKDNEYFLKRVKYFYED